MNGKVAIITGSSSGIGRETAIYFSSLGAKVVITGRREQLVNQVVEECNQLSPMKYKAIGVVGDVTDGSHLEHLVNQTLEEFGKIDILVNNAATGAPTPITDPQFMPKYQKIMDTNLKSVMEMCHLCVPHLEKTKGRIVNVGAIHGQRPFANSSVFCVSKAAINMFTKCLAIELGPKGIRVNCVNPSYIRTNILRDVMSMGEDAIKQFESKRENEYPLRRVGEAIDVAKSIAFLVSDDSSFVTGECMLVDGGALYTHS